MSRSTRPGRQTCCWRAQQLILHSIRCMHARGSVFSYNHPSNKARSAGHLTHVARAMTLLLKMQDAHTCQLPEQAVCQRDVPVCGPISDELDGEGYVGGHDNSQIAVDVSSNLNQSSQRALAAADTAQQSTAQHVKNTCPSKQCRRPSSLDTVPKNELCSCDTKVARLLAALTRSRTHAR